MTFTVFNLSRWKNNSVIIHDIQVYYSYLPALFIYNDLSFQFKYKEGIAKEVSDNVWYLTTPEGKPVQKMTCGLSLLYAPFFFIGHAFALLLEEPANGYSTVYQMAIALSSLFYAWVSIFIMRKLLRTFFDDRSTALTLAFVYLGTNLFFYIISEGAMSHNYSVFVITLFLYLCVKWIENKKAFLLFLIGLTGGLAALIRPVNAIIFLFPLLYFILSLKKEELKKYASVSSLLLLIAGGLLAISPQLFYWKTATGSWIYYSYSDEGFFFLNPAIMKGLFSFRKGWLIYTPLVLFGLWGFYWLYKKQKSIAIPSILIIAIYSYVAFSWWCWWYGGSFGMRAMIDVLPFIALGFAAFSENMLNNQENPYSTKLYVAAVLLGIGLNQFQVYQYRKGILHYDSMTSQAYWKIFGQIHYPENYDTFVESPDYEAAKRGEDR